MRVRHGQGVVVHSLVPVVERDQDRPRGQRTARAPVGGRPGVVTGVRPRSAITGICPANASGVTGTAWVASFGRADTAWCA